MDDIDFDQVLRSEHLTFHVERFTGRTYVVQVRSRSSGDHLGHIQWWGAWRQYVLVPAPGTLFNAGCMDDVKIVFTHLEHLRSSRD